ncbi:MAG: hypothetical protein Kow00133_21140 [Amphiplicatus sp.]
MTFRELLSAAPDSFALRIVDAGAAGGLDARWRPLRAVVAGMLFDPREQAVAGTPGAPGRDCVYPSLLGRAEGEATLYFTELGAMSSTLKPNQALLERFLKKRRHGRVTAEETFRVEPLDAVAARHDFYPDILKADVQGGERAVLEGAQTSLERAVILVEVEVSFLERYEGQPRFCAIESFLERFGFELIDLVRLKRYRHENSAGLGNLSLGRGQRAGRVAYGDAIFLLREDAAARRAEAMDRPARAAFALKAVLALLAYGKADMAARWFDLHRDAFDAPLAGAIARTLRRIGRRRYGPGHLHHLFDYAARKL